MAVWKGSAQKTIPAPVAKVWPLVSDFCGLSKWWPAGLLESCEMVGGEDAQMPGCVRRVVTTKLSSGDGGKSFANEKLLEFDAEQHLIKYVLEENSVNLDGYVGTMKLSSQDDEEGGSTWTLVEWSYEMPALEVTTEEEVSSFVLSMFDVLLQSMCDAATTLDMP